MDAWSVFEKEMLEQNYPEVSENINTKLVKDTDVKPKHNKKNICIHWKLSFTWKAEYMNWLKPGVWASGLPTAKYF